MNMDRPNEHEIDRLLKRVLVDDLPPETEFRMRKRVTGFRRAAAAAWRHKVEQWLDRHRALRKEVLAYVSMLMLAAGAVIHLGGHQSLLADSIALLKKSMSLAGQMRRAGTMDCVIRVPAAGREATTYHIRWVRDRGTRVDIESPLNPAETLWISGRQGVIAGSGTGSTPVLPEPIMALVSPPDLAGRLDERWQLQPERKQAGPDTLVFFDRQDRALIEVHFDSLSFLPVRLSRQAAGEGGKVMTGGEAMTAGFIWNRPIAPELMTPRVNPGR